MDNNTEKFKFYIPDLRTIQAKFLVFIMIIFFAALSFAFGLMAYQEYWINNRDVAFIIVMSLISLTSFITLMLQIISIIKIHTITVYENIIEIKYNLLRYLNYNEDLNNIAEFKNSSRTLLSGNRGISLYFKNKKAKLIIYTPYTDTVNISRLKKFLESKNINESD